MLKSEYLAEKFNTHSFYKKHKSASLPIVFAILVGDSSNL
jgi:hypothetical protein